MDRKVYVEIFFTKREKMASEKKSRSGNSKEESGKTKDSDEEDLFVSIFSF